MATSWFICNYKVRINQARVVRYCAMDDFTAQIIADGGNWAESEVLGGYAIVKVRATETTLAAIAAEPNFVRLPLNRLVDKLSTLSPAQRTAIANRISAMGYTVEEITALGNLRDLTLADILRFAASRRHKARYNANTTAIILDGDIVTCRSIDTVDAEITE